MEVFSFIFRRLFLTYWNTGKAYFNDKVARNSNYSYIAKLFHLIFYKDDDESW